MALDNVTKGNEQGASESSQGEHGSSADEAHAHEDDNAPAAEPARWQRLKGLRRALFRFSSEIVFGLLTLTLAVLTLTLTLGQYYQSGYSTRIGITTIWEEGYTDDTRNRVAKFTLHSKSWARDAAGARRSLDILIDPELVFDANKIKQDPNLMPLLADDLKEKERELKMDEKGLLDHDYVEAALKYRNAIISSLNTMEAVKAVIQARPKLLKIFGKPDLLEERYGDLIEERTIDLHPFIERYRCHYKRSIEAWYMLTENEPRNVNCP